MKCPVCKEPDLVMSERQNIEIDYCPQCRGVWLDRGELDKIIERNQQEEARYSIPPAAQSQPNTVAQAPSTVPGHSTFLQPQHGGFNDIQYGRGGHHRSEHGDSHRSSGGFLKKLFD